MYSLRNVNVASVSSCPTLHNMSCNVILFEVTNIYCADVGTTYAVRFTSYYYILWIQILI